MKKLSSKQKLIGAIAIILVTVILAIVITTNIVNKGKITSEDYFATTANANSNLVANYIKKGITIGGITGTWIPSGVEFEEITFSFEGLKIKQNITGYEGYIQKIIEGNAYVEISDGSKIVAEAFLNAEGEFPISVLEDIKYNTPGTYKYYARQTNEDSNGWKYDHNTYEIVVEVTINNERLEADIISDDIIFTNNYSVSPTTVVLGGLVYIQDNNVGISLNNFVFELKNEDGEIISTVNAMDDGMIAFDEIRFELPGTYNYTISQVDTKIENVIYDLHVENVTITVTDNSMGSLDVNINNLSIVFENKYNQSTE